jgi:hypothetical protein
MRMSERAPTAGTKTYPVYTSLVPPRGRRPDRQDRVRGKGLWANGGTDAEARQDARGRVPRVSRRGHADRAWASPAIAADVPACILAAPQGRAAGTHQRRVNVPRRNRAEGG